MSSIRIRGVKNTTALERGVEVVVERTERIDRLIAKGYVVEVPDSKSVAAQPVTDEIGNSAPEPVPLTPEQVGQSDVNEPPLRNALTEVWLDYVRGLQIEEPDDASRAKLQADYDEYRAALSDG